MTRIRLAELCSSASLFTDLGTGQPVEHGLRTCVVAMRLGEALGLSNVQRSELFYVTLLRFLGCTADAHVVAEMSAGDEIRLFSGLAPVVMGSPREEMLTMLRKVAEGAPLPRRMRSLARALTDPRGKTPLLEAHCEVAGRLAREMGLPDGVTNALGVAYARWDGTGVPLGLGGHDIPVSVRVAIVARDLDIWGREAGVDQTSVVLRGRRARAYDPEVVDAALDIGVEALRHLRDELWETVLALEPEPWAHLPDSQVDRALTALGEFGDLKVPRRMGHSRRVTEVTSRAAGLAGLEPKEIDTLTRAARVHDVGMVAVPAGAIAAAGARTSGQWEQYRTHPMWTERILARCQGMDAIARLGGRHHERRNGSGYPAGISDSVDRQWGILACAVAYVETTSPSAEPPIDAEQAAAHLADLGATGAFSVDDVKAVLRAVEVRPPLVEVERPAGLTEREVDVLVLLSRGMTNRQIASELGLSDKTVGTHVEHMYAKAGVRSRAAAALFAARHGLV